MTNFLLDTNVISALAPARRAERPLPAGLADWLTGNERTLFISVVTIIELETGLNKLGRKSPGRFHKELSDWYDTIYRSFEDRMLPIDAATAHLAADIADTNAALGLSADLADVVIAATARVHRMTLLTRNIRHFTAAGISMSDPFTSLPD